MEVQMMLVSKGIAMVRKFVNQCKYLRSAPWSGRSCLGTMMSPSAILTIANGRFRLCTEAFWRGIIAVHIAAALRTSGVKKVVGADSQ